MTHRITCLIPTCKNTCGRNNTKTTFLEIFFIGYHFITARKVSSAISSLNVCENVTGYIDISLPERPEVFKREKVEHCRNHFTGIKASERNFMPRIIDACFKNRQLF